MQGFIVRLCHCEDCCGKEEMLAELLNQLVDDNTPLGIS